MPSFDSSASIWAELIIGPLIANDVARGERLRGGVTDLGGVVAILGGGVTDRGGVVPDRLLRDRGGVSGKSDELPAAAVNPMLFEDALELEPSGGWAMPRTPLAPKNHVCRSVEGAVLSGDARAGVRPVSGLTGAMRACWTKI